MENETTNQNAPTGGLKLMTVFIVVLALHVLVIGGIGAYTLLKGNDTAEVVTPSEETTTAITPAETKTEAAAAKAVAEEATQTSVSSPSPEILSAEERAHKAVEQAKIMTEKPVDIQPMISAESGTEGKSSETFIYTVKFGDTLTKVARIHGMKLAEIRAFNHLSSDLLKVGQKLNVGKTTVVATTLAPKQEALAVAVRPVAKVAPEAVAKKILARASIASYTVSKGDTLSKIARQFKTTPSAIMAANKLSDANKLKIGMKLAIPASSRQEVSGQQETMPLISNPVAESSDLVMR